MDREVLVYVDLNGVPHLVGRLWSRTRKSRREVYVPERDTFVRVPVYDGHAMRCGHRVTGPALIWRVKDGKPEEVKVLSSQDMDGLFKQVGN